ncbi:glycosyltransferase family 4 protein [Vibrio fluvialis]|uniref:glycosyltransferase family 4 protein n=1 Tax=Vibrio fluvialis TaxID=676 RepID=UPI001559D1C2|nr:glycosyltransferase family 4 protein [Vibrio fluvialis]ELV8683160.1 glycosyltransferase family 4 protein [Vibrio fluvialis]EMC0409106.1 glycosyltransferase family 4 protein [Vibrio fluvialis]MBY8035705.1 glycosyltransferase family 4 protein [Vibrio fluvialis]MBY8159756.1 glycosyltransferase family 4 protein [Vibrio fluvialis]MBY8194685.1 glycosyltransferase family 4 protein [Vibrio fluvialis]
MAAQLCKKTREQQMKRICFVNTSMSWGGGEKWHAVAAKLCNTTADVTVVTKPSSKLQAKMMEDGIAVFVTKISNASFLNPFKIYTLYRHFKSRQYDTVVLNLPADAKCAGVAAKLAGIPKIIYRRGMPHPIKNNVINRFLFKHIITDVIVNSEEIRRSITKNNINMIERSKIHTIYNGVNCSDYHKDIPSIVTRHNSQIVLGTTGRCVEQKNQLMLVECMRSLKGKGHNVKLYIAGTGPLQETIQREINQHGLQDSIIMLGFLTDPRPLLAGLDIYVFPSHYEGSANAIVEAMAMGLPVVSFHVSSMPEMVKHNQTGKLAQYPNNSDFTTQIESLLTDAELRQRLGTNSRKMAEEHFDNTLIFEQIKIILLGE